MLIKYYKVFFLTSVFFIPSLFGQVEENSLNSEKPCLSYIKDKYFNEIMLCVTLSPFFKDEKKKQELRTEPIFLVHGDRARLKFNVLENKNFFYHFTLISSTDSQVITANAETNSLSSFSLVLKYPGEETLAFSYEGVTHQSFDFEKWSLIPERVIDSGIIYVPIVLGNEDAGLKENSSFFPSSLFFEKARIISDNLKSGNRGSVNIEIPHLQQDESEINIDPITLRLAPSFIYNVTQVIFSVYHPVVYNPYYFGPPCSLVSFKLENQQDLYQSSVLSVYDWVESRKNSYLVIPKKAGVEMLDFSYTKIIQGDYVNRWSWNSAPSKKVTTKVHVPIKIIDYHEHEP